MEGRIAALPLLVAAAGYVSTSGLAIDPWRFGLLMLTGFLASAGASAINHYIDRDLDSLMGRTRARPLPAHRIQAPRRAPGFGLGLSLVPLSVAYLGLK